MPFAVDPFRSEDLEAGLRLSTQAGWNQVEADWKRVYDLCPDRFFAGRLDGRVVATGCVASYGRAVAWIGLILVDEACRGRGFGGLMFARAIDRAREIAGDAVGLDASGLGRPVYLKQGFRDVAPIDRWSGVLKAAGSSLPTIRRGTASGIEAIASVDRSAVGVDRTALLRHLVQDRDVLCLTAPGEGHAFLSPGRVHAHLGPVVARDDGVFDALLGQASRELAGSEVVIDAVRTPSTTAILQARGLSIARRLTRMTLARPQPLLMGPAARAAASFTWG